MFPFLQAQRDAQIIPSHLIPLRVLSFGEKQRHPAPAAAEVRAEYLDIVLGFVGHHRILDDAHKLLGLVQRLARRHLKGQVHPHLVALLIVGALHAIHGDLDAGEQDQGDDEGVEAIVQHPAQRAHVVPAGPSDHPRLAFFLARRQLERGERDEDQGDEQRGHQPRDDRQADSEHPERKHFLVAHQNQGQEDHHGRQGRHGHLEPHLAGPLNRGRAWGDAFLALAVDVFDDDDGVVNHQPQAQHEAHHRRHVQRPAYEVQGGNRRQNGQRDRQGDDQGDAHRA